MPNISKTRQDRFWEKWIDSGAIGYTTPHKDLIDALKDEVWFDCHPTEVAFSRADSLKLILEIGPSVLKSVAGNIKDSFRHQMMTTKIPSDQVDWNLFGVYVWLICRIRLKYKLKQTPYGGSIPFCEMDIWPWYRYCLSVE